MYKPVLVFLACIFYQSAIAQYFFKDIITANNSGKNYRLLKVNKVKRVAATSIEPDGTETENFGIVQMVDGSKQTLTTITSSGITGTSNLVTSFNGHDQPVKTIDSSANTVNTMSYSYDDAGRLLLLSSHSHEPGDTNQYAIQEDHQYFYDANGKLVKMLKIENRHDTLTVVFVPTENGLPGEEKWYKKNRNIETWFYYYDDKKQLTDIVRYNVTAKKMLPDYVFEYNAAGQPSQQTVVQAGTNFYRLWLYEYRENGLKKAETVFNKGKEQEGRIVYEYE